MTPGFSRSLVMRQHGLPGYRVIRQRSSGVRARPRLRRCLRHHQRLCGPLANSLFDRRPDPTFQPDSKLEAAIHKADDSIRKVIHFIEAT